MNVIYLDRITRSDARNNCDVLFIFGDNDARSGYGGQAEELRGEPNSHGIRVKKSPEMRSSSFYTDDEYDENIQKIMKDIAAIFTRKEYQISKTLVFPAAGVGTGFAQISSRAPRTAKFLEDTLKQFGFSNGVKPK